MTKIVSIPNGTLTLCESKAKCPHCERVILFEEIERKWVNAKKSYMRIKCKCKKRIGITADIKGDFVAF